MRLCSLLSVAALAAGAYASETGATAENKSAWVKFCENGTCHTYHERLDGNTGLVLFSASVRTVDGSNRKVLAITIPRGMATARGLKAAVYTKVQWYRRELNQEVRDRELRPFDLKFSPCDDNGCSAEVEATPHLINEMKAGGGIIAIAFKPTGQSIGFPFPLDGFAEAWDGPPVDTAAFKSARRDLIEAIHQGQKAPSPSPKSDGPPPLIGDDGFVLRGP
jgi:invasion protein IalB